MLDNLLLLVQFPPLAVDVVVNGLLIGAIFALAAYGMALVWGVLNIVNVVQGELVVLGGYVTFLLVQWGMPPLLGVPASALVMFGVGWVLYRAIVFRVVDKDIFISILATFGLAILIQQLANLSFGADVRSVDAGLGSVYFLDGMVTVAWVKLIAFMLALVAGASLWFSSATRGSGRRSAPRRRTRARRASSASIRAASMPQPTRSTRRCAARQAVSPSWPGPSILIWACLIRCVPSWSWSLPVSAMSARWLRPGSVSARLKTSPALCSAPNSRSPSSSR